MGELVLVERRGDGVAEVTLNNPKVNALSAGYSVTDWGARISVAEVIDRVAREQIEVLFLSVLMLRSALLVSQVRQGLSQLDLHPLIVVGGAPFRFDPDLAQEVGADYVGRSASDVLPILATIEASR